MDGPATLAVPAGDPGAVEIFQHLDGQIAADTAQVAEPGGAEPAVAGQGSGLDSHRLKAAKLAGGALGAFSGIRREVEALVHQQLDRLLARMDLVTRDEFNAVKAMAVAAREENETLSARLDRLETVSAKKAAKN